MVSLEGEGRQAGGLILIGDGHSVGLYSRLLGRTRREKEREDTSSADSTCPGFPLCRAVEVYAPDGGDEDDDLETASAEVEVVLLSRGARAIERTYTRERIKKEGLVALVQLDWRRPETWCERLLEVFKDLEEALGTLEASSLTKTQEKSGLQTGWELGNRPR